MAAAQRIRGRSRLVSWVSIGLFGAAIGVVALPVAMVGASISAVHKSASYKGSACSLVKNAVASTALGATVTSKAQGKGACQYSTAAGSLPVTARIALYTGSALAAQHTTATKFLQVTAHGFGGEGTSIPGVGTKAESYAGGTDVLVLVGSSLIDVSTVEGPANGAQVLATDAAKTLKG